MDLSKISRRKNPASGINGARKIYMIGIKGVGMTMLAQFFSENGIEVLGSDVSEKFMTDKVLEKCKIKVIENFSRNNIPRDADLIVYSSAYNAETNEEVAAVVNPPAPNPPTPLIRGASQPPNPPYQGGSVKARVLTYAEALGEVFNQRYGIAVVGSHGKTTTTAWLGYVLEKAGIHPSVLVGASVPQFGGAALVSKSDYMIIEADEYQNKFKHFNPKAVLLNNIDYDHPDFFPTEEDYKNVFVELIKKIPKKGFLVANWDDAIVRKIANVNCVGKVITYAIDESADYVAYDIKTHNGKQFFKVKMAADDDSVPDALKASGTLNGGLGGFSIGLSGRHNVSNALAVIAACVELGVELVDIRKYLEEFAGTARRMEIMGEFNGATIIDDYAHHPAEIKATLAGARETYGNRKIKVVFHPHTFTRTKAMLNEFAESFNDADEVIVLDIYGSAREKQGGVSSEDLVEKIGIRNKELGIRQKVSHIPTLKESEEHLRETVEKDDLVILMGAGDVFRVGENLVK